MGKVQEEAADYHPNCFNFQNHNLSLGITYLTKMVGANPRVVRWFPRWITDPDNFLPPLKLFRILREQKLRDTHFTFWGPIEASCKVKISLALNKVIGKD